MLIGEKNVGISKDELQKGIQNISW